MFRLIFLFIIGYLCYRLLRQFFKVPRDISNGKFNNTVIDDMVQDPFCKTYIPRREAIKRVMKGKEILFCSEECADKYEFEKKNEKKSIRRVK